jgi:hypothetical protein
MRQYNPLGATGWRCQMMRHNGASSVGRKFVWVDSGENRPDSNFFRHYRHCFPRNAFI